MITGEPSYITDGKCVTVFFLGFFICPLVLVEKTEQEFFLLPLWRIFEVVLEEIGLLSCFSVHVSTTRRF